MKNKPLYAIESVDKALLLATLIHREGPQRVTDAADLVDVSVSTAHRLFSMLVYRGFAVQLADRRYGPGPLLSAEQTERSHTPLRQLRRASRRHLEALAEATGETANLVVRVGAEVRNVATVESPQAVRVGDRTGFSYPALATSTGRAILARCDAAVVVPLIAQAGLDRNETLLALEEIRRQGYAVSQSEEGLVAVGIAFHAFDELIGIAVAMPSPRFATPMVPALVDHLREAAAAIEAELAEA